MTNFLGMTSPSKDNLISANTPVIDKTNAKDTKEIPDGGFYAWFVVVSSFLSVMGSAGITVSFGVFQQYYTTNFDSFQGPHSTFAIAFIGSLANSGLGLYGLPVGILIDTFGPKLINFIGGIGILLSLLVASYATHYIHLIITQGIFLGFFVAMTYFASLSIIAHYFEKKKGLAFGLVVAGSGVGGLWIAPVTQALLSHGMQSALRTLGLGGGLLCCATSIALKPRLPPSSRVGFSYKSVYNNPHFKQLFFVAFFASFGFFIPFYFISSFATQHQLTSSQGALMLGIMNGGNGIGRILLGLAADSFGHLNTLCISLLLGGLSTILIWPFATTFESIFAFALIYGIFMGGYISLLPSAIAKLLGKGNLSIKNGMVYSSFFIGHLIGSPVAGLLQDALTREVDGIRKTDFLPTMGICGFVILVAFFIMIRIKYTFGGRTWFTLI